MTGKQLLASARIAVVDVSSANAEFDEALIAAAELAEDAYNHSQSMSLLNEELLGQTESVSSVSSSSGSIDAGEEKGENVGGAVCTSSSRYTSSSSCSSTSSGTEAAETQHAQQTDTISSKSVTESSNDRTAAGGKDMTDQTTALMNMSGQKGSKKQAATTLNSARTHSTTEKSTSLLAKRKEHTLEDADDDDEGISAKKKSRRSKRVADDEVEGEDEDGADSALLQRPSLTHSEEKTLKGQTEARRLHNISNPDAHSVRDAMLEMKSRCPFCYDETCTKYCAAACSAIYDAADKDPVAKSRERAKHWCNVCSLTRNEEKSKSFCEPLDKIVGKNPLGM